MTIKDCLKILALTQGVTVKQIKNAHRGMVKKYHPDVYSGKDADQRTSDINQAKDMLLEYMDLHGQTKLEVKLQSSTKTSSTTEFHNVQFTRETTRIIEIDVYCALKQMLSKTSIEVPVYEPEPFIADIVTPGVICNSLTYRHENLILSVNFKLTDTKIGDFRWVGFVPVDSRGVDRLPCTLFEGDTPIELTTEAENFIVSYCESGSSVYLEQSCPLPFGSFTHGAEIVYIDKVEKVLYIKDRGFPFLTVLGSRNSTLLINYKKC